MQIWDAALVGKGSVLPVMGTERRRSVRGTLAGTLVACHLLGKGKGDWGFWLEKEECKGGDGQWGSYSADGIIYSLR